MVNYLVRTTRNPVLNGTDGISFIDLCCSPTKETADDTLKFSKIAEWKGGHGSRSLHNGNMQLDLPTVESIPPVPSVVPITVRRRAILARLLAVANLLVFASGWYLAWRSGSGTEYLKGRGHPVTVYTLSKLGALSGPDLLNGEWWRLFTYAFVHIGAIHLLANVLMMVALGSVSERIWGCGRFAAIYFGSALAGSIVAMSLHPRANGGATVLAGASGALWGVLLSILVWYVRFRNRLPPDMVREWRWKLGAALFLNALISFVPGVSLEAHAGGGLAGAAMAYWLDRSARPHRGVSAMGVAVLLAGLLLGLLGAMRYSPAWQALREPTPDRVEPIVEPTPLPLIDPATEQAMVIAAMAEYDGKLAPLRLNKLFDRLVRVDTILGKNTPKSVAEVEALRSDARAAQAILAPFSGEFARKYADYVARVEEFVDAVSAWQALPPRSPLDEVAARRMSALEALVKLNGK